MTFHTVEDWPDIRLDVTSLIEANYALAPPQIISECSPLLLTKEITVNQFLKLKMAVASFYNWARREAGFPYDRSKINKKYVPANDILIKSGIFLEGILVLATVFFFVYFLRSAVQKENIEQIGYGLLINIIPYCLYFGWIFFLFREK